MRRLLLATVVTVALMVQLSPTALATGPGGWDHLGHGATTAVPALNGAVYALNADDPGMLYAGGNFTDAGGHANADHLAKWNGVAWSAVNGSVTLNGDVHAIAFKAGKVYVGGEFTNVGGDPNLDFLAEWTGTTWVSPCNASPAVNASVQALQIIGNTLYIGGSFANGAGIASADYLLACDLTTGTPRSTVPSETGAITGAILALTADGNGTLYAGGTFSNLTGIAAADDVAAYSGGTWHAMGSVPGPAAGAVQDRVRSLAANGTDVYVGTDALNIANIPQADHIAKWNGSAWSAMGANTAGTDGWFGPPFAYIYAIATSGSLVFAAGSFQNANGKATADDIAYFDGTKWRPLGSDGAGNGPLNAQVSALAGYRLGLCAGGNFTNAGGDGLADVVASYALLRPDARIGTHLAGPFVGNNVYHASGAGQAKTISVQRSHSGTLYVDIQNDGLFADAFKVTGPSGAHGFTLSYFHGATNVTSQVLAGTYSTGSLAPRAHLTLKMVVAVSSTSANSGTFLVEARAPGERPDAVKAIVNAT